MEILPTIVFLKNLIERQGLSINRFAETVNDVARRQMTDSRKAMLEIAERGTNDKSPESVNFFNNRSKIGTAFVRLEKSVLHSDGGANFAVLDYLIEHQNRLHYMQGNAYLQLHSDTVKKLKKSYVYWDKLEAEDRLSISSRAIQRYLNPKDDRQSPGAQKSRVDKDSRFKWIVNNVIPSVLTKTSHLRVCESEFLVYESDGNIYNFHAQFDGFASTQYGIIFERIVQAVGNEHALRNSLNSMLSFLGNIGTHTYELADDRDNTSLDVLGSGAYIVTPNEPADRPVTVAAGDETLLHDAIRGFYDHIIVIKDLIFDDAGTQYGGKAMMDYIDNQVIPALINSEDFAKIKALNDHESLRNNPFLSDKSARWLLMRCTHNDTRIHRNFHSQINAALT